MARLGQDLDLLHRLNLWLKRIVNIFNCFYTVIYRFIAYPISADPLNGAAVKP
jgi:hypothetical protein